MAHEYAQILGTKDVAQLLGVSVQEVRRLAREGTLPAYRLPGGRVLKFFRDEIFKYVVEHPPSL